MSNNTLKKQLKNQLKNFLTKIVEYIKKGRLSEKSIGMMIRVFHFVAPRDIFLIILLAPQFYCNIVMVFFIFVSVMFYTFDSCFLTILEETLCQDNFTLMDPSLELLNFEVNNKNRFTISVFSGIIYILVIISIYYYRFFYSSKQIQEIIIPQPNLDIQT